MEQFLTEYLIGERGPNLPYSIFGEICLIRFHRPCHHVNMGMIALIVERSVPAKVLRRYLHRRGDVVAMGTQ